MQLQTNNFHPEIFFTIASQEEIIQSFRERDQKKLILPDNFKFPLAVRSYLTWNARVSTSYFLCHDLSCIEKIEDADGLAGKNPDKHIAELYHRIEKLFEKISNYKRD